MILRIMAPSLVRLAVMAAASLLAATTQPAVDLRDELVRVGGFTSADVTRFDAGEVIARLAPGEGDGEVSALAAVRIRTSKDQAAGYFDQYLSYEDGSVTLQFGRFSRPPAPADVSRLTLDSADVDGLRRCKAGDCDIRIGAAMIDEVQRAVDWKAPDAADRVNALARERIVEYVRAYLERGNAALITYNDRSQPVSLQQQWQGILANTPYFAHYAPPLKQYVDAFPRATLPGATDTIYWAKENYGLPKPVIHVTHMITWRDPARPDRILVEQKQIYASHYYDGSLALTAIVDLPPVDGKPACAMVYFNRSRGDLLKGGFGGVRRRMAQDQARKAAVQTLTTIRDVLEKAAGLR
jgi:hypothetical protein